MNELFTSGPWHAVQTDSQMNSEGTTVVCLNRPGKDKYYVFADQVSHGDVAADAALIANAPQLYHALREAVHILEYTDFDVCGLPMERMEYFKYLLAKTTAI